MFPLQKIKAKQDEKVQTYYYQMYSGLYSLVSGWLALVVPNSLTTFHIEDLPPQIFSSTK